MVFIKYQIEMSYFRSQAHMLLLLRLSICISISSIPIGISQFALDNQTVIGFTTNEVLTYQSCLQTISKDSLSLHKVNTTLTSFTFECKNLTKMKMRKKQSSSSYLVGSLVNNILIFYQVLTGSIIQWYNTSLAVSKVLMSQQLANYAFALNTAQTVVVRIDIISNRVQQNISFSPTQRIVDIVYDGGFVAGYYSINNTSLTFFILDINLTLVNQLTIPWQSTNVKSFRFLSNSNTLVITCANQVQLWNVTQNSKILNIPNNFTTNTNFTDAVTCNGLIFIFSDKLLNIYEEMNLTFYQTANITGGFPQMAQCFPNESKVAVVIKSSTSNLSYVKYFTFNYTNSINLTNSTNSTNSTTDNNSSQNVLPNNSQPTIPQSTNHLSANTDQIHNISLHIKTAVLSPESTNVGEITSNVAGLTSATALLKPIMQPFTGFIEDFWFYGFHQFEYPEFVQLFTEEIDIINQLRIKPQFLNFQLQFPDLESANSRQVEVKLLQDKAPESQYMLQATKDIYTVNFATSLVLFAVVKLMCLLLKSIRHSCLVFKKAYFFLSPISKWWSLMIAVFESNITPIVFYASLQFNSFVCFDLFSKFNLMMTLLMFFTFQTYAFVFYPLLFQFGRRKSRKKVSDFGKGRPNSYWLEMCLKCLRSYFQSLVHGLCINGNLIQLLGLIVSDFAFLVAVIRLRNMFSSKAVLLSAALYFVLFLTFDITLIVYRYFRSFQVQGSRRKEQEIYFEFVTMLIIVLLLMIMIAKIFINIFSALWKTIAERLKKNNEIVDQSALKNKKKSITFKLKSQKSKNVIIYNKTLGCSKQELQKESKVSKLVIKSIKKVKGCENSRVGLEVKWVGSKTEKKKD